MADWTGSGDILFAFLRAGHRTMSPRLEFRETKQAASEAHLSWLHIRITLEKSIYFRKQFVERASILCRVTSENNTIDDIRDLRWRSPNKREGEFYITLEHGRAEFVPVVLRNEVTSETQLTDQSFLVHHKDILSLPPQIYSINFTVKFQAKEYISPTYILHVPETNVSNGHFTLEKVYSDES